MQEQNRELKAALEKETSRPVSGSMAADHQMLDFKKMFAETKAEIHRVLRDSLSSGAHRTFRGKGGRLPLAGRCLRRVERKIKREAKKERGRENKRKGTKIRKRGKGRA